MPPTFLLTSSLHEALSLIIAQNCSDSEEKGKIVVAVSKHFSTLVSSRMKEGR